MSELARITEPRPVTVVVFGGGADYVSTTCELTERAFAERVEYVFANTDLDPYEAIAERFDSPTVAIALPDVCQGLREIQRDHGMAEETLFPKLGGGTARMDAQRARWVEEQITLVHWEPGLLTGDQFEEDSFLRGAMISWDELGAGIDADRDVTAKLEQQIRRELGERERPDV